MLDPTTYPQVAMKIVTAEDGHYDLMFRAADGTVKVFARVPIERGHEAEAYRQAELVSASFLMLHALSYLIEWVQPELWTTDDSPAWHNAFVAYGTAAGADTPAWLTYNKHGEVVGPSA